MQEGGDAIRCMSLTRNDATNPLELGYQDISTPPSAAPHIQPPRVHPQTL